MSRIEWSRYNGDDIEALVAMFISADYPEAERITPSSGDGGIDVLVESDKTRVYQVKKFHTALTSSQKTQIKESVDRLVSDPRVKHLKIDEWHVVMPWDPTLEAKAWLTEYVLDKGLPAPIWDGLTRCDLWASTYPHIIDYYLQGNAERIKQAALEIVHGLRLKQIADEEIENFDISLMVSKLRETAEFLNNEDPFFAYGLHFEPRSSMPTKEELIEAVNRTKPGVIFSTQWGTEHMNVQIDIYPKNRVALQVRPINFNVQIASEPNSSQATAVEDFLKYGSPLELPIGSVTGTSEVPGGLYADFNNAALIALPVTELSGPYQDLRLLVFSPEGIQIDSIVLSREYITTGLPTENGPRGLETRLSDASGILQAVSRFDVDSQIHLLNLHLDRPDGRLVVDILPVLQFYRSFQAPNSFAMAPRFGPIPSSREQLPEEENEYESARLWYEIAKSLELIQEKTPLPLHFPNLSDMGEESIASIIRTGALLDGQAVHCKVGQVATIHDPEMPDTSGETVLLLPWEVCLPDGTVDLGHLAYAFNGLLISRATEGPQGLLDVWEVEGNELLIRMPTETERQIL